MGWTNPDSVHRASTGALTPAAWGDMVNDNLVFLGSTVGGVIGTSQTTTSTSYTDLSTPGPQLSVTTGAAALVIVGCLMTNDTAGAETHMSVAVSSATTLAAADINSVMWTAPVANGFVRMSHVFIVGLAAGANTFTAKYRVSAGTGTFSERRIAIIPLP